MLLCNFKLVVSFHGIYRTLICYYAICNAAVCHQAISTIGVSDHEVCNSTEIVRYGTRDQDLGPKKGSWVWGLKNIEPQTQRYIGTGPLRRT